LAGDKVKFTVRFRGREMAHPDIGREMLEHMAEELRDVAAVEQRPLMEGRALSLLLAPSAKAKAQRERPPVANQPTSPRPTAGDAVPAKAEQANATPVRGEEEGP
jgi:translation initiation factor IF-3